MNSIKVGDRVQWQGVNKRTNEVAIITGTVTCMTGYYQVYLLDDNYFGWMLSTDDLTPISDTAIVQAIAAQPQDDQEREDVLAALRNAGSLGGAL